MVVADASFAFENKDVVDQIVHKRAVVADDDGASFVAFQKALEDTYCVDIQVVGGLVEDKEVGVGHQHGEQIQPAPFAAAEVAEVVVLRGVVKAEIGEELVCRHFFAILQLDDVGHFADDVDHAHIVLGLHSVLGVKSKANGLSHNDMATVGLHLFGDDGKERAFANAVGSNDADFLAFLESVRKVVEHFAALERLADVVQLQDFSTDALGLYCQFGAFLLEACMGFLFQFVEGVDAGSGFGAAGLRHTSHPVQLGAIQAFGFFDLGAFVVFAFGFLLKIIVEGAAIVVQSAVVQLDNVLTDVVQKISVVRYHQYGQTLFAEEIFEPFNHTDVQMVGRLVE